MMRQNNPDRPFGLLRSFCLCRRIDVYRPRLEMRAQRGNGIGAIWTWHSIRIGCDNLLLAGLELPYPRSCESLASRLCWGWRRDFDKNIEKYLTSLTENYLA